MTIKINPARFSQFGSAEGSIFCLITNREIESELEIVKDAPYAEYRTIILSPGDDFEAMLADETIPQRSHSLVISLIDSSSPPRKRLSARIAS